MVERLDYLVGESVNRICRELKFSKKLTLTDYEKCKSLVSKAIYNAIEELLLKR